MKPAWSVILFTTLAGAGQGLFFALFAADLSGSSSRGFLVIGMILSLLLLGAGLVASFFHLGRPERAWRTVAMWRTSWLSREVIVLPGFMFLAALYAFFILTNQNQTAQAVGALAAVACIGLFFCTGMIYACLPFLQEWRTPLTPLNFLALGCASGLMLATALAALLDPALARAFAIAALVVGAIAYALRIGSLVRNAGLRPKSTLQSAIGTRNPQVRQIAQGSMGGSFNTREFFHGRPREVVRAARWGFLLLVFPVPAVLLLAEIPHAAFAVQFLGLLAERWYFFAEAKHPQNLYYQAIA
jgi:DMSO reductase anchor subunit